MQEVLALTIMLKLRPVFQMLHFVPLVQYFSNNNSISLPITFGSRLLIKTEIKYFQIEKEALAITFGCEHFQIYLYGRSFQMEITAHRSTSSSPSHPENQRQHKWKDGYTDCRSMISQDYDFTRVYQPGPQNLADTLSQLPNKTPRSNMESCAD